MTDRGDLPSAEALTLMSAAEFVSAWCRIVGEPPAIVLESRREMIRILAGDMPPMPVRADEQPALPAAESGQAPL